MGLNFQPWISENFKTKKGKYGRLLLLGESHYIEKDELEKDENIKEPNQAKSEAQNANNFTSDVVQNFLDSKHNNPFFRNLGLLFNPNDKFELWNEVAFANGIQVKLANPKAQPTRMHIETVKNAFWLLLDNLKPDKILVCSKRMWDNWIPEDSIRCRFIKYVKKNGKHSEIWEYKTGNKNCLAIGIRHPSSYFSYNSWRPIVRDFVSRN